MLNPKLTYHVMGLKSDLKGSIESFKDIAYGYSDNSGALNDYSRIKNALGNDVFMDSTSGEVKEQGPFALVMKLVGNMFGLKT